MNIPFWGKDVCEHTKHELRPNSEKGTYSAQWHGEHVQVRRFRIYHEHCAECGERLGMIGYDDEGNVGREMLESFTIPAEVVEEYRND